MQRIVLIAALSIVMTAEPSLAQDRKTGPVLPDGEIAIPSEQTLERDAVTPPRNDFSRDDNTATKQMDEQNRRIDREVEKGICTDC
ncbi:hypothetical protein MHY87_07955 [Microvirga sp. ACRRW]|uniref:hypothetical protein n=1 Tax=Microvirga sp. ACRRW TaxID=2918205 RepID=UPI001EF58D9A|nr:hypothetical protein [Microvirga sp. ACRRW]MCG7392834.1 hypothetical protein [Microvirga sp. ACRRW]